jgi:hypothetical protein
MELLNFLGIRIDVKKEVFQFFQGKFFKLSEEHPRTARWIKDRLRDRAQLNFYWTWEENKNAERSDLCNSSVYELICRIENALDGHEYQRTSNSSSDSKVVRTPRGNRPKATPDQDVDFRMLAKKIEGWWNFRLRQRRADIKKIMTDAEVFIIKKQGDFSEERIAMRDAETDNWRSHWGSDSTM